jgi:hypothetical protein
MRWLVVANEISSGRTESRRTAGIDREETQESPILSQIDTAAVIDNPESRLINRALCQLLFSSVCTIRDQDQGSSWFTGWLVGRSP